MADQSHRWRSTEQVRWNQRLGSSSGQEQEGGDVVRRQRRLRLPAGRAHGDERAPREPSRPHPHLRAAATRGMKGGER